MTVMERMARSVVVPVVVLERVEDAVPTAQALLAGMEDVQAGRVTEGPAAIQALKEKYGI